MASSFISMDGTHGFWIHDSFMVVTCWGLVNAIDSIDKNEHWAKGEFREHMFYNSQGFFIGFMHLRLDEFLTTPERINEFNGIIQQAKDFFLKKGDYIPSYELDSFQLTKETKYTWVMPFETSSPIKVLNFLQDVVNNKITLTASDVIDYDF